MAPRRVVGWGVKLWDGQWGVWHTSHTRINPCNTGNIESMVVEQVIGSIQDVPSVAPVGTAIHVSGVNGRGMESEEGRACFWKDNSGKVKVPGQRGQKDLIRYEIRWTEMSVPRLSLWFPQCAKTWRSVDDILTVEIIVEASRVGMPSSGWCQRQCSDCAQWHLAFDFRWF